MKIRIEYGGSSFSPKDDLPFRQHKGWAVGWADAESKTSIRNRSSKPRHWAVPADTPNKLVLGNLDAALSGCDKTSLVMSVKNQAGALSSLLTPFSEAGVSMTHLESRPIKNALWEYVFFVDILGHREDEKVKDALNKLEARAAWVKILGSYPVSPL